MRSLPARPDLRGCSIVAVVCALVSIGAAQSDKSNTEYIPSPSAIGSPYVQVGNWVYPVLERLIARGYIKRAFLGLRPWTRIACAEMVQEARESSDTPFPADIEEMIRSLEKEFSVELRALDGNLTREVGLESAYTRPMGVAGTPVNDSYHLGQTLINDFGRPYQEGFNNVTGFTARGQASRFAMYVNGEYQHAPGAGAYPLSVRQIFATADDTPVPSGAPIPTTNQFRLLDTYVSANAIGLDFSVGKQSLWWGPTESGGMAMSNNATPFWMFRIDRNDPFRIPFLSRFTGPFRFDFYFGELAGKQFPPQPWVHSQKISFKPSPNLEFGFSRVVVFAGANHVPLTFGSFWTSFTSLGDVSAATKHSRNDPGARHSAFDASYRVPGLRDWLTIYTDSIVHDDVSPISAPHRGAWNPGFYLSRIPGIPKMDLRAEAVSTDPPSNPQPGGQFIYWEAVYRDVYLNDGSLFGNWIGRQGKGYQGWLTYWLSAKDSVQLQYRHANVSPKFIPGGTTQNDIGVEADIWVRKEFEVTAFVQYERWMIPVLATTGQNNFTTAVKLTFWPKDLVGFHN